MNWQLSFAADTRMRPRNDVILNERADSATSHPA
jgi:hypothetical protein